MLQMLIITTPIVLAAETRRLRCLTRTQNPDFKHRTAHQTSDVVVSANASTEPSTAVPELIRDNTDRRVMNRESTGSKTSSSKDTINSRTDILKRVLSAVMRWGNEAGNDLAFWSSHRARTWSRQLCSRYVERATNPRPEERQP
jgi:hypothetical protein